MYYPTTIPNKIIIICATYEKVIKNIRIIPKWCTAEMK
jgi:hypothetical protein